MSLPCQPCETVTKEWEEWGKRSEGVSRRARQLGRRTTGGRRGGRGGKQKGLELEEEEKRRRLEEKRKEGRGLIAESE